MHLGRYWENDVYESGLRNMGGKGGFVDIVIEEGYIPQT